MTAHSISPACHRSKQIRIGGSRSKNGCSTCKIRRVKCDESRPDCTRCTSTGRQCDGYAFSPRIRIRGWRQYHEMPVVPPARSLAYHSFSTSARGWEYFYYGCFDQVFGGSQFKWIKPLIIQLGHQENAVMSAVAAFSSMHEAAFQTSSMKSPTPKHLQASPINNSTFLSNTSESVAAISAYYASVKSLQHAIEKHGRVAAPAALVCCILFAALNMVQCDYDGAVCHIEHGLGILAREQSIERRGGTLCLPGWSSTAADGVMSVLVSGFYRLTITAFFYGRTETLLQDHIAVAAAPRTGRHPDDVVPFGDMDEARVSLSTLAGNTLKFAAEVSRYRDNAIPPPLECFQRRDERLDQLHSWNASFRATPTTTSSETPDEIGLRMVQIVLESQFLALVILLCACLVPDESGYDSCFDQFRSILVLCEEYVALYSASLSSWSVEPTRDVKTFTFDMEILPQLWLVGKKCRHREYRRRCISLLEKYHRKEGVWDPRLICQLAKRTMEIEESALSKGSISLPENLDRLWTVDLDSRHANSSLVAFAYKPTALGGRGLSWKEMILLGKGTGPVTKIWQDE